ncbi:MAG: DUF1559 domain-containing protein [Thermoguttaceae bacterium]
MVPTYAGIAGTIGGANATIPNYTESRMSYNAGNGWLSAGGFLFSGSALNFSDLTDGSSNVMAVSEQGDYLVDVNGVKGPLQDDFGRGDRHRRHQRREIPGESPRGGPPRGN